MGRGGAAPSSRRITAPSLIKAVFSRVTISPSWALILPSAAVSQSGGDCSASARLRNSTPAGRSPGDDSVLSSAPFTKTSLTASIPGGLAKPVFELRGRYLPAQRAEAGA